MSRLSLEISNRYSPLESPEAATADLFAAIGDSGKFPIGDGELSVAFVDDATIARIHADFMNDPSPTDVITFQADPAMGSAGEIIVSVDHALKRSVELDEPFSQELALYLLHGWLHLAGFDDRRESDRVKMRAAEKESLDLLKSCGKLPQYRLSKNA